MHALRRVLGLEDHVSPPLTDERVRSAVTRRVMEQSRRLRAIDTQIQAQRAGDRR